MATARSSSAGTSQGPTPTPAVPEQDYVNPGVFVVAGQPVFIVEDASLAHLTRDLPMMRIPWSALTTIKASVPDVSRDIVICGWDGVADILEQLERALVSRARGR